VIDPEKLQVAYQKADHEFRIRQSKIGCVTALILVPAGVSLDYYVYPHLLGTIFYIRLLCDLLLGAILALHFIPRFKKYLSCLIFAWPITIDIAICYMIYLSEGAGSPYYAGLNLVVICVTFLLPLTFIEALAITSITIFIYLISVFAHNPDISISNNLLFNNLYFLTLTGIISCTACFFNARRRFSEFSLQYELDIRNQELDNRNQKLAELDRLKSEFFANVSHELRTPLTLILTPIQDSLRNKTLSPEMTAMLQLVEQNALRLLKLVNELLDLIQLEEGKKVLNKQTVDLHTVLNSTVESMRHLAETKNLTVQVQLATAPAVILADAQSLEKIIINLVNNAIKFTDESGKIIINSEIDNKIVKVNIKDTGIGISSEDLPHIFERFRQADGSTTRQYQGTGLGLALVKELVEKNEGNVQASSELGIGTILSIEFPLTDEIPQDIKNESDALTRLHQEAGRYIAPAYVDKSLSGLKENDTPSLLIVDDEPHILDYLTSLLKEDYQILQAIDGDQALTIAREQQPTLILLDFMLPKRSGLDVCQALKQDVATQSTKIILLTARVDESAKITALQSGADDFLTKPFSSTEVKTRLQNLLQATQLEKDLRDNYIELENTLTELQKTQSKLVHSEKLNSLGSLAAGLLHEIHNPLNYVLTAAQLLQQDQAIQNDEDLQDTCNDFLEGLERIRLIVTDLRIFAYPSEINTYTTFDFTEVVNTSLRFVASETKGISIEKQLSEQVAVVGSQANIVQVMINLLSNATKAVEGVDKPTIRIVSQTVDKRLQVQVMDNGKGIDSEHEKQIFDPFFTTRDVGEGMGLGLSTCHTIIKNHDGSLDLIKELDGWTIFCFDLPLLIES